jgi:hypothetical protein
MNPLLQQLHILDQSLAQLSPCLSLDLFKIPSNKCDEVKAIHMQKIALCILPKNNCLDSAQLESMFGLVELKYSLRDSFFIFYLFRLWLGCIPKISFLACLKVPKKFLWVVVV